MVNETIAAISTAPGEGGIAIVRVSGPSALLIADQVFRCDAPVPSDRPGGTFVHGFVHQPGPPADQSDVDEAILLIYRSPKSYTREDVIELQGHGGRVSARRILAAVLRAGARMAEPGEFTQRAFLSGRLDLLQAEAVMDLISSKSDRMASAAVEQLEGRLSATIDELYASLLDVGGDMEATLDFGEDELPAATIPQILKDLNDIVASLQALLDTWQEGHILREGALVVIAGRPNVGKSTLMNALLGKDRAIVTPTAGTTRDTLEESVVIDGIPIRLVDTAGLHSSQCHIEQEGMRRASASMTRADLVLRVLDSSLELSEDEMKNLRNMDPSTSLLILNKSDLPAHPTLSDVRDLEVLSCSLAQNRGVDELRREIVRKLGISPALDTPHATISERHRTFLLTSLEALNEGADILRTKGEEDVAIAASCVRSALETLGEMTGRTYTDDLLSNVFSRFCIGK